jgi:pimeloyl-ACP methyl ester carboxylesterase
MRTHPLMAKAEYGEDEFAEAGGYWIHYVEAGGGTPVILIPGAFSTYRVWNPILPILAKEYRPIAVDCLGTGDSDKPAGGFRYTVGEQADLLAELFRTLRLTKPYLIGAASGGTIAFNLAARHPEAVGKIVSIEGGILPPRAAPAGPLEKILRRPVLGDLAVALLRTGWFNRAVLRGAAGDWFEKSTRGERKRLLRELSFSLRSATRAAWYWTAKSTGTFVPFAEEAGRIKAPVLYLAGGQSDYRETAAGTIRFLERHLPHSRIVRFDDGVRDLQSQIPYDAAREIMDFFAS